VASSEQGRGELEGFLFVPERGIATTTGIITRGWVTAPL
jgi:hypothetical protein